MRIPPNLKYFLFFLLAIGLIVLGTLYLPRLIPGIGKIVIAIVLITMSLASFFVLFKPAFSFLFARADGIFAVYSDQSKNGFHVFAYHINNSSRYSGFSTRDIQHYYIVMDTGKLFYNCIYTHPMKPMSGRSGWEGFSNFEESVLASPLFGQSMKKLSGKTGTVLQLDQRINSSGENHFIIEIMEKRAELKKFSTATDEGIKITCTAKTSLTTLWEKKI